MQPMLPVRRWHVHERHGPGTQSEAIASMHGHDFMGASSGSPAAKQSKTRQRTWTAQGIISHDQGEEGHCMGARLRGRKATQRSKKGSPWSHKPPLLNGRFGNCKIWGVQGNSPTLCQPFANPSPTFCQPFANLFCQRLSNPLFPWTPGTRLETRVNGFLGSEKVLGKGSEEGFSEGFWEGGCYGPYSKKGFWEGFSEGVLRRGLPEGA